MSTASILERMIEPFAECLTRDAAQKIVELRADDETQAEFDELAEKANRGILSPEEKAGYERLLAALHVVSVLQVRARRILKD